MNDLEQRLKDLLEADAAKAPVVWRAPDQLQSRVRRRQWGTALVGTITVLAVIAVSIAGLRAIDPPTAEPMQDQTPARPAVAFTAQVGIFAISTSSDWFLIDRPTTGDCGRLERQCVDLQLSSFDPGLAGSACGDVPQYGVALIVSSAPDLKTDDGTPLPTWPSTRESSAIDGRCGAGRYFGFQASGHPYEAWIGQGEEATEGTIDRIMWSFHNMTIDRAFWMGSPSAPSYIVAARTKPRPEWRIELLPLPGTAPGFVLTERSWRHRTAPPLTILPGEEIGDLVAAPGPHEFGVVTKKAATVTILRVAGASTWPANIVPLPPSLGDALDLYYHTYGPMPGLTRAVARDANGKRIASAL